LVERRAPLRLTAPSDSSCLSTRSTASALPPVSPRISEAATPSVVTSATTFSGVSALRRALVPLLGVVVLLRRPFVRVARALAPLPRALAPLVEAGRRVRRRRVVVVAAAGVAVPD